jgi:4-hydroxythreonine-4-phosphate dehydrogenase
MTLKPIFAITMGDPAGVGPEIIIKALSCHVYTNVLVIGDLSVLKKTADMLKVSLLFKSIRTIDDFDPACINIYDMNIISPDSFVMGTNTPECGTAAYEYVKKAIKMALDGSIAGVITNPINKESLKLAGINYPGHTEIFAAGTGVSNFTMLFYLENIGVAHVTTHCSLVNAIKLITEQRVFDQIVLLNRAMKQLGIIKPRLAVGGLNPHAGEHGLFGTEEIEQIEPAIQKAQATGINVHGPYPPDTVFMRAFRGEFDGVVAMLHDHGFVALKSRDFEHGVNITFGLPIIRTSVGHGTAFDIAGKGIASPESLLSAIDVACRLYENRNL